MTQQKKNYVLPIAMMFALFAMISFVTGLTIVSYKNEVSYFLIYFSTPNL